MYHSISEAHEDHRHPYFQTNTSPAVFAEQMKLLHENHYEVLSIDEAIRCLCDFSVNTFAQQMDRYRSRVVLTFDDGFRDFYTEAAPVLDRYGFRATVFLPTGFITEERGVLWNKQESLNWNEARSLKKKGHHFGSHSVNHRQMGVLRRIEIEHEIGDSKKTIEDQLGDSITSFSCPYAFPDENPKIVHFIKKVLKQSGYENGVTTRIGTVSSGDDSLLLKRIPINTYDDTSLFLAKLDGAYDWLYTPQLYIKRLIYMSRNSFKHYRLHNSDHIW